MKFSKKGDDVCKMRKMVFCVSEKERDEAEDLVLAMVLCVSDPETEEETEEVWKRERRRWKGLRKTKKKMKRFEKERSLKEMILCVGYGE